MNDAVRLIAPMLSGNELISAMTVLPCYDESVCTESAAVRLTALSSLYDIYLPSQMSLEIYSKLYLALLRSLQTKCSRQAMHQQKQNFMAVRQREHSVILGGSDSFTILGVSGIGKSSAVGRAIDLISSGGIIETTSPLAKIIPCLTVQTPFDCSVKGLLLEVLRKVDERLGSRYYETAQRTRSTTDMLIGSVSQVALNHVGLLVVDEIQNVVSNRYGRNLVGMLTQLINNSGISICMVGTPESTVFFEQAMQLARRSLGLQYGRLEFDQYFHEFCSTIFRYQYVQHQSHITPAIIEWLYEHSGGVISLVISLIHDAQEMAILDGSESLDLVNLRKAYKQRLSLLHGYIAPGPQMSRTKGKTLAPSIPQIQEETNEGYSIAQLVSLAKNNDMEIVSLLREYMSVAEVVV